MITVAQCVFDLNRAGAQQVLAHIAALRDRSRFDIKVYAFHDGALSSDLRGSDVLVRIVPQTLPYFDPLLSVRLAWLFRKDKVDVVHTHMFGADLHAGVANWLRASRPALSTVHSEHHDTWRQRVVAGAVLGRFQRIVAVAQRVADYLTASWPALAPKVAIIPNGVRDPGDVEILRHQSRALLGLSMSDLVIGTVGRLSREKAPLDLLAAFTVVAKREPRARLVYVGDGGLRHELLRACDRNGLGNAVIIAGSQPDAARLIPGFDVFALTSHWEGLPMALLEAMMAGVACVATDVGAVSEVLRDGENGRLLPPARPDLFAGALLDLLGNAGARSALGRSARQHAASRGSARKMVAAYEDLYQVLHRSQR